MIIQTKDLTGAALDWEVAKAVGQDLFTDGGGVLRVGGLAVKWSPSTNWSQCGPLIEKRISILDKAYGNTDVYGEEYYAETPCCYFASGPTYLIAACRAIVAAELGGSVDVPDELVGAAS